MSFSEDQIQSISPNVAAFAAGKKLSAAQNWSVSSSSERAIWGEIKGSGKNPYYTQVDLRSIAFKCTCPSRQFPCKHAIGLMLLFATSPGQLKRGDEPEWVSSWLDGRSAKQATADEKAAKEKPEKEEKAQNKNKTQEKRLEQVTSGAIEVELWLKDLIRLGILQLASKPRSEFQKVTARLIDAKAPGLAAWVRTLGELPFHAGSEWHDEALQLIARLFMLIQAIKNYDSLDDTWQATVRTLSGFSQSSKELLASDEAETVNDHWLIAGQLEEQTDDIITQRNWLIGSKTGRKALILNFATRFSTFETVLMPGQQFEGDLAFFPSVWPHRAAAKNMKLSERSPDHFLPHENWKSVQQEKASIIKSNPWANDLPMILDQARLSQIGDRWYITDQASAGRAVVPKSPIEKALKWLAISGNEPVKAAVVLRDQQVIPLGIFYQNQYFVL